MNLPKPRPGEFAESTFEAATMLGCSPMTTQTDGWPGRTPDGRADDVCVVRPALPPGQLLGVWTTTLSRVRDRCRVRSRRAELFGLPCAGPASAAGPASVCGQSVRRRRLGRVQRVAIQSLRTAPSELGPTLARSSEIFIPLFPC